MSAGLPGPAQTGPPVFKVAGDRTTAKAKFSLAAIMSLSRGLPYGRVESGKPPSYSFGAGNREVGLPPSLTYLQARVGRLAQVHSPNSVLKHTRVPWCLSVTLTTFRIKELLGRQGS